MQSYQEDEGVLLVHKVVNIEEGEEDGARVQVIARQPDGLNP